MKNIFYLFIAVAALSSCKSQPPMTGNPEEVINISGNLQTSFYDNVYDYDTLRLETTSESALSDIMKIRIYDGKIYLLDGRSNSRLMVFEKESGKFLRTIGRKGRGPQEYIELYNFEIDHTRKELLLLDRSGSKILIYDLEGGFLQTVKAESGPECVGRLPNGNFVLAHIGNQLKFNENHIISICDLNGNILERHIENKIKTSISIAGREMMSAMSDGTLSLMPQYHNMIYHISDEGITTTLGFSIPGETLTVDDFDQNLNETRSFLDALEGKNYIDGNHAETSKYLFFYNKGVMELEHIFYNKATRQSLRLRHPLLGTSVSIDDEGYVWACVNEARIRVSKTENDELAKKFLDAFGKYENVPLIFYKVNIF